MRRLSNSLISILPRSFATTKYITAHHDPQNISTCLNYKIHTTTIRYKSHLAAPPPPPLQQVPPIVSLQQHLLRSSKEEEEEEDLILIDTSQEGEDYNKYCTSWARTYQAPTSSSCSSSSSSISSRQNYIVALPKTIPALQRLLKYCNENVIGVTVQGGNTGLVGGSVPVSSNEIIINLSHLNRIQHFDETNGILTVEAGAIIQTCQEFCADRGYLLPIDLGSSGSAQIGGVVSTNAGGQYYYRFGSLHANVLGLTVVTPDGGQIFDLSNTNRKDNTGYDLKHLFIGAEGTLGVVAEVMIACPKLPQSKSVCMLFCRDFTAVQDLLLLAKDQLCEILSAFEMMDQSVLEFVAAARGGESYGINISRSYPFSVLIETQGSHEEHDREKMEQFFANAMEANLVLDGIIAKDLSQAQTLWEIRESCNPIMGSIGYTYKYDVSLPIKNYYDIVVQMKEHLQAFKEDIIVTSWGHVIDGNLHLNITTPKCFSKRDDIYKRIEPHVFDLVMNYGGSISAEHGLGIQEKDYMKIIKKRNILETMWMVKHHFDPKGILNRGKYLPSSFDV